MKPTFGPVSNTTGTTQSGSADANPPEAEARRTSPRQSRDARFGGLSSLFGTLSCEPSRTGRGAAPGPSRGIPATGGTLENTTIANLSVAQEVLRDVRQTYYKSPSFKSSNKWRTKVDQELEVARLKAASSSVNGMRDHTLRTISDIKNATGHNCGELSRLAVDLLSRKNVRAVHIVIGAASIAHTFAAILPNGCAEQKSWESDMDKWHEGIIICDPWANIACPAPEFNRLLVEKLDKWDTEGKRISNEGRWVSANDEKLRSAIIGGDKRTLIASSPPRKLGFHIK